MKYFYHLLSQLLIICFMASGVAVADTDKYSPDPETTLLEKYAQFKQDIATTPALKSCDAQALQQYMLNHRKDYLQSKILIDSFTIGPLQKTPPEDQQMVHPPQIKSSVYTKDSTPESIMAEADANQKRYKAELKVFNDFHDDLNHVFTRFFLADNQMFLVRLCQSTNLKVLNSNHSTSTAVMDVRLMFKSADASDLQLWLSRSWASWELFDVAVNEKRLSDKYGLIFTDVIAAKGLVGLKNDLKAKVDEQKKLGQPLLADYFLPSPEQLAFEKAQSALKLEESNKTAAYDFSQDYFVLLKPDDPRLPQLKPDKDAQAYDFRNGQMPMGEAPLKFYDGDLTNKQEHNIKGYDTPPEVLFSDNNPIVQTDIAKLLAELEIPDLAINYSLYIDHNDEWHEQIYLLAFLSSFDCLDKSKSTLLSSADKKKNKAEQNNPVSHYVLDNALLANTPLHKRLLFVTRGTNEQLIIAHASVAKSFMGKSGIVVIPIRDYAVNNMPTS